MCVPEVDIDSLSSEELSFFKRYGYLIKSQAVPMTHCQALLERMWESAPAHLTKDDPLSWTAVPPDASHDDSLLVQQDTRWQLRSASTERLLIEAAYNPQVTQWAEQLLGAGTLRAPVIDGTPMGSWGPAWPGGPVDPQLGDGVRGIYATLPQSGNKPRLPNQLHTDGHPFHLGAVLLLADNPPDGGAFRIWPASHARFYPLFPMQYDQARVPFYEHLPSHKGIVHPPEYLTEVARVEADTPSVDCHGKAGDLVLWHHRLGHMAGHNYAKPPTIRQALLYDFCKTDLDATRKDPPQADMWRDWGNELRAADAAIGDALASRQRLPETLR